MRHQAAERECDRETTDGLRRCALTRTSRPKDELLRFVLAPDGTIVPDLKERLPGRGVWITAANDSVAEAERRNVFARALKTEVRIPQGLAGIVERLLTEAAVSALALANKAGEVVFGAAKVEEAIDRGKAVGVVHASEAAQDSCRKLDGKLYRIKGETALPPVKALSSHELGLASGRTNVIHAALIQGGAALRFYAAASRLERYRRGSAAFAARNGLDTDKE